MADYDPKALRTLVEQTTRPLNIDLTFKAMFGGIMAYTQGKPFASLSNVGLAIKLDLENQKALLEHDGAAFLKYETDSTPSKQYVVVPATWHSDETQLATWLKKSADFVGTLPAPKKRTPKKG